MNHSSYEVISIRNLVTAMAKVNNMMYLLMCVVKSIHKALRQTHITETRQNNGRTLGQRGGGSPHRKGKRTNFLCVKIMFTKKVALRVLAILSRQKWHPRRKTKMEIQLDRGLKPSEFIQKTHENFQCKIFDLYQQ